MLSWSLGRNTDSECWTVCLSMLDKKEVGVTQTQSDILWINEDYNKLEIRGAHRYDTAVKALCTM